MGHGSCGRGGSSRKAPPQRAGDAGLVGGEREPVGGRAFFDEQGALRRIDALSPGDDAEFARRLVETELALIADADDPVRIYLRLAVVRATRVALRARTEIRNLPERRMPSHTRYGCNPRYAADGPGGGA
jgi:hypothetical protein